MPGEWTETCRTRREDLLGMEMEHKNVVPVLSHHGDAEESSVLPSFQSLREKNLRTLYGDTRISDYVGNDKSPKGCVDEKIRPLVDRINLHPEFVTLSSCSGRVAMFHPAGSYDDGQDFSVDTDGKAGAEESSDEHRIISTQKVKGTERSGKGRGKWIFVTHDILPDLGPQLIQSLRAAGQERGSHREPTESNAACNEPPITFKHEPPLLHVAAASLEAGKKLLHLAKSVCAMRESGLVVTDQRVTVELRTTGTLLCVPLMVGAAATSPSLVPGEEYLMSLAEVANERMVRNEMLLEKLHAAVLDQLFETCEDREAADARDRTTTISPEEMSGNKYKVTLQRLPELNLWKTAAVAVPRNGPNGEGGNLDILAFGGQGIGPNTVGASMSKASTCRRWDTVFRLARRDGAWSARWDKISVASPKAQAKVSVANNGNSDLDESQQTTFSTSAGKYRVQLASRLGPREGHCACVVPPLDAAESLGTNHPTAIALFGGRTGGPLSPSNDFFLFVISDSHEMEEIGMLGIPTDIRGTPPEPRFGYSMTALWSKVGVHPQSAESLAVVAGGTGVMNGATSTLSSVHVLSRALDNETGLSHFIWDQVSDMPYPRSYHTSFMDERASSLFIFGGIAAADDPFGSFDGEGNRESQGPSYFKVSPFGKDTTIAQTPNSDTAMSELSALIGSSAVALDLKSRGVVLHVGGAGSAANSASSRKGPISILDQNGSPHQLKRAQISSIEFEVDETREENSSSGIDLGPCAHHSLVALPRQKSGESASAVIVGGGVPSSFGQSYARSFLVTVGEVYCDVKETTSTAKHQTTTGRVKQSLNATSTSRNEATNGTQQVDVVYVSARHAKDVKVELESQGYLDKRYKMVKLSGDVADSLGHQGTTLIAIPVTKSYASQPLEHDTVLGSGKEMVPFSSSSIGKMKQGKCLR